ncbi:hypothetical protein SteCoe_5755 [Stentor coeruleus]|uniref:Ubiquitin-like domain-containing protein n=1 Tax=Stentor coeruleus TaxID=5963 RepID=A0A1R2CRJ0_9CILI|nr:hypothetical protein SteCoe_5755 [Stentor coeruleus]
MGNYCTRSEPDDTVTKPKFSIGKDYQEIEGQFVGEGIKKTLAWKATITRLQLDLKREEFWQTRATGRRNVWVVIKNAIEADHETAALLLQMSGIILKSENISILEDTNGNVYEIPPFIVNDPVCFANEKKKAVPKQNIQENVEIIVKIRKPGVADDKSFTINNLKTGMELKQIYAESESIPVENLRLFFGGREMNYANNLAMHCVQNDMVIHAFIKSLEPL